MAKPVSIIGAGLAGSEAALQLAKRDIDVVLYEMRPDNPTAVHKTGDCAELVCSNSLKSTKPDSAAGMLKHELETLGSVVYKTALKHAVPAGGALAVNRVSFAREVTELIESESRINLVRREVDSISEIVEESSAVILATGPLTSDALASSLASLIGDEYLAFYDAAAPIVMGESLDMSTIFRQSRYEDPGADGVAGDYLNAPMDKEEYERFIDELLAADRVISRDFESKDLFQACQPIEEIARAGRDAPRFGPLKPVGLIDPRTGRRPWAAVQLRAEDASGTSYNLVGFQTNLKFPEQKRVFSMIPGLENAEFVRYGVMHRNTFINAPEQLDSSLQLVSDKALSLCAPIFVAGQLGGTEGYCEAIRSGLHAAFSVISKLKGTGFVPIPTDTVFGALIAHATSDETENYQPMHVNFGIMPPLDNPIRNKRDRYEAYRKRGNDALESYCAELIRQGILEGACHDV